MEEKKSQKHFPSLWTFSNFRRAGWSFLGEHNSPLRFASAWPLNKNCQSAKGFTLIELLIVIIILGILAAFTLVALNPLAQIEKGQDTQRQHNIKQLTTALDSYYNDNNYYPASPAELIPAKDIQTVPNDPTASSSWPNYAYIEDSQWNVLFVKLAFPSSTFSCPLAQMKDSNGNTCLPLDYSSFGYNYCVISGSVKCDQIVAMHATPLPIITPPTHPFYCWCKDAGSLIDSTRDPSHQCQIVQVSSDPSVNANRYCYDIFHPSRYHPCVYPCTQ